MATPSSVDEVVAAIQKMGEEDRETLIVRLAQIDDLMEDIEDAMELIRASRTKSRPFEEFLAELRAERGDV